MLPLKHSMNLNSRTSAHDFSVTSNALGFQVLILV